MIACPEEPGGNQYGKRVEGGNGLERYHESLEEIKVDEFH